MGSGLIQYCIDQNPAKTKYPWPIKKLNDFLRGPLDLHQCHWKDLNAISHMLTKSKKGAKNQCHKLKCVVGVQWCPMVTVAINKILFWKSVLKQAGKVGLSILNSRACKAGLREVPIHGEYEIQSLKDLISKAYKQFWHLKLDENHWDTCIVQLISTQAEASNCTKRSLWQQQQTMEQIWQTASNVCWALKKIANHQPLLVVVAVGDLPELGRNTTRKLSQKRLA